ncbi:MAG: hypothetical protein B0A82_05745 [Alkalinema sp. CACIAM 70d]|nr:MAG: hypothetical protein B0A82_05745 [Alkalinema sp. CACIAM 70d]
MSVRIASHLYRNRHGTFYFRLVIPAGLRRVAQRTEIHVSLETEQRRAAIIRALPFIHAAPNLLATLKSMAEHDTPPSPDYARLWIEQQRRIVELQERNEALQAKLDEQQLLLNQSVLRARAVETVKNAHMQGQLRGKADLENALVFPWPSERTRPFSELSCEYLKSLTQRPAGGNRRPPVPKTMQEYERDIGLFVWVMGDLRIGAIDRAIAGTYFNTLRKLPANLNRLPKYRGKSVEEILAMGDPPQKESNASKKMERISTMFGWALDEKRVWGIDTNPFTGYGRAKDASTSRRPFTPDELRALLLDATFQQRKFRTKYSYWLIPLAIFTGARLGELCQLDVKDFVEEDGIPCIDINDIDATETVTEGGRVKRVKNKNAKRLVPIHTELIRLGLLRYVDQLRAQGQKHLFGDLNRARRDGPAHAASNWFQRLRARVGITVKQEAVFHSFRHLFITSLLDSGIPPHMVAPIVGHEAELITGKVYWNVRDARKRQPTVEVFALQSDVLALIPRVEDVQFL